jgi:flavin reductase (DIM6/NTAB) family NADH-FMN oxidoreductase RutF
MTKDFFFKSKRGILQLLTPQQHSLVNILGKHSGYEAGYSKQTECAKLGYDWVTTDLFEENDDNGMELHILPNCALYLVLKVQSTIPAGDHELALCEVAQTCQMDGDGTLVQADPNGALDETTVLYTRQLRQMGIL